MQFFGYRRRSDAAVDQTTAYETTAYATEEDIKAAYQNGRRDERARRRRFPLLTACVAVVALVGAGVLALAAYNGSFSQGGQVVDRNLSVAAGQAGVVGRDAAVATTEAVRDAGDSLRARVDKAG